jgi:hypothetical protein
MYVSTTYVYVGVRVHTSGTSSNSLFMYVKCIKTSLYAHVRVDTICGIHVSTYVFVDTMRVCMCRHYVCVCVCVEMKSIMYDGIRAEHKCKQCAPQM